MIPQPKSIMTHEHLQRLFADAHPNGKLSLSKDVGGAKRRYSVRFTESGKSYSYAGTAKDVAVSLDLLPQYAIRRVGIPGNVIEHWNQAELQGICDYCNSEGYAVAEKAIAIAWGDTGYVHPVFRVVKIS